MKGKNTIVMNQATLQLAIAHYLRTVLFREGRAFCVTSVSQSSKQLSGSPLCCDVEIECSEGSVATGTACEAAR